MAIKISSLIAGNSSITLIGDVSGTGISPVTTTLNNTAVTPGTYGSSSDVGSFIVNSQGRITSATNAPISITPSQAGLGNVSNSLQVINAGGAPSIREGPGITVTNGNGVGGDPTIALTGGTTGKLLQTVVGNIPLASFTPVAATVITFDNNVPQITEGLQIWSQSFTPLSATSTIVITSTGFYSINNNADVYTTVATFNGTTCFGATANFTTDDINVTAFNVIATQTSGSTATRTYSVRMGPNVIQPMLLNQQTHQTIGTPVFGGVANIGRFIIQEISA